MNREDKNRMPVNVLLAQISLGCGLCMLLAAGCMMSPGLGGGGGSSTNDNSPANNNDGNSDSSENDNGTDGLIDAKIFDAVLRVESYDTSDPESPQYASVATLLFATFPVDPLAVSYTVDYVRTDVEGQNFSGTWRQNEPIANRFAVGGDVFEREIWPGYDGGISGGEYYVVFHSTGCGSGSPGACMVGTPSTIETENILRELRRHSTATVTIEYE
jgi:hypothetical protein